jgi:hypothetical protein
MSKLDNANIATLLVALIALIIVVAGAVVTIVNPDALPFDDYVKALATLGIGAGALGVGRGVLAGAKQPGGFGASPADVLTEPLPIDPPVDPGGTTLRPPGTVGFSSPDEDI